MKRFATVLIVLALSTVAVQTALAQSDLGVKRIGVQLGLVDPENVDATLGFGAFVDHGTLARHWKLSSHLEYWSKSEDVPLGGTSSVHDIVLGSRARFMIPVSSPRMQPYVGGGLGLHFLSGKVEVPDMIVGGFLVPGFTATSSDTKLGLDLGGGFEAPINPKNSMLAELWFGIVSDVNQVSLRVGLEHRLGL